jgi:hypothetical protein
MIKNIAGQRFGRVVAIEPTGEKRWRVSMWRYVCDCGVEKIAAVNSLMSGNIKSCGCLQKELASKAQLKHGMYGTPEYLSWGSMIQRCTNPKNNNFKNYGGRGISVCKSWRDSFESFFQDMGRRPTDTSLDRIDVNGNYEPENCRWSTALCQARNKQNTITTFTEAEKVRELYLSGTTPSQITAILGLSRGSVNGVIFLGQISKPNDF